MALLTPRLDGYGRAGSHEVTTGRRLFLRSGGVVACLGVGCLLQIRVRGPG